MPRVCLQFVIVVFPDHTHLLFLFYVTLHVRIEWSEYFTLIKYIVDFNKCTLSPPANYCKFGNFREGFNFRETSHMPSSVKIKSSRIGEITL